MVKGCKVMRQLLTLAFWNLLICFSLSGQQKLNSSVYDWEKLKVIKTSTGEERDFFRSPTRSLDNFHIKAITLIPGEEGNNLKIDPGVDELIVIKEGKIDIRINGDQRILGAGSVIVISSGSDVFILNPLTSNAVYYLIAFKPYKNPATQNGKEIVPSLFIDWRDVEFKPSEIGGRRNIMQQKTTVLKELEIHVTTIKEGLSSHAGHSHPDEELILVREGVVEMKINDKSFKAGPGSLFFLGNDDFHGLTNAGKGQCEYYAIRWLTE
jgi:uncharacterized cupin superfamily protein